MSSPGRERSLKLLNGAVPLLDRTRLSERLFLEPQQSRINFHIGALNLFFPVEAFNLVDNFGVFRGHYEPRNSLYLLFFTGAMPGYEPAPNTLESMSCKLEEGHEEEKRREIKLNNECKWERDIWC